MPYWSVTTITLDLIRIYFLGFSAYSNANDYAHAEAHTHARAYRSRDC
jgi:hypothetical protein